MRLNKLVNCKGKEIERFVELVGFTGSGRVERGEREIERELDVKSKNSKIIIFFPKQNDIVLGFQDSLKNI